MSHAIRFPMAAKWRVVVPVLLTGFVVAILLVINRSDRTARADAPRGAEGQSVLVPPVKYAVAAAPEPRSAPITTRQEVALPLASARPAQTNPAFDPPPEPVPPGELLPAPVADHPQAAPKAERGQGGVEGGGGEGVVIRGDQGGGVQAGGGEGLRIDGAHGARVQFGGGQGFRINGRFGGGVQFGGGRGVIIGSGVGTD